MADTPAVPASTYTCLSCRVGFSTGDAQRQHFTTDWHRYNLKRKIANMPPITAQAFRERATAQKDEETRAATVVTFSAHCEACNKSFSSANTQATHNNSKKHREAEEALARRKAREERDREYEAKKSAELSTQEGEKETGKEAKTEAETETAAEKKPLTQPRTMEERRAQVAARLKEDPNAIPLPDYVYTYTKTHTHTEGEAEGEKEEGEEGESEGESEGEGEGEGEEGIREESDLSPVLLPEDCLFCQHRAASVCECVTHMAHTHGLFLPNAEFIVNLTGLLTYLQFKVGVLLMCLKCEESGRVFASLSALRAHMLSSGHTQLNYTHTHTLDQLGEFYDFSSTYPDDAEITEEERDAPLSSSLSLSRTTGGQGSLDAGQEALSSLSISLPNGQRAGHRSLLRFYKQRYTHTHLHTFTRESDAIASVVAQYRRLASSSPLQISSIRAAPGKSSAFQNPNFAGSGGLQTSSSGLQNLGLARSGSLQKGVFKAQERESRRGQREGAKVGVKANKLMLLKPQIMF